MFRDQDRWPALSPLLDEALELEASERATWLAELERRQPDLAPILERLLSEHERLRGSDFLESSLAAEDTPGASLAGHAVGPYTLEAPLGVGGMGTVWRARRSDGRFEGHVAVKLLNLALLDRAGDERFKREGTLLARLAHPNIARLLDAGVTTTGQPYLVLELVDGRRIDHFADERRLDPFERLELLLQVADAVAHAHASLVVHRDLKPSNILVSADGEIKLLDFGVGKLIEESGNAQGTLTAPAAIALTPEYAAPEQARGDLVTTATDVYALGVLLYTLLTGRHPTGEGSRTPANHLRALLEDDATRASDAVMGPVRQDAAARAALRQATPERLRRLYRGDIDNLLAKALEKTPERRYSSVTALSDDIRRFLNQEPLSVRGQAWTYRASKFIRRHRWPVAAALGAFIVLAAGALVANNQRLIAERRFNQLQQLSEQVFALDGRIQNLAGATEARQALVGASLQYLEGLASDAGGDLDLMQQLSDGYWRVARIQGVPTGLTLGNFAEAEKSLKKADGLVTQILSSRPRDRRALERGAMIAHDRMIVADTQRREAEALVHARAAIERIESLLATDSTTTSSQREAAYFVFNNAALAHVNLRRYDDGIRYSNRTLELAKSWGLKPESLSAPLSIKANALRSQGDLDGALNAIQEARALLDQSAPTDDGKRMIFRYPVLLREALILGEDRAISLDRPEEAIAVLRNTLELLLTVVRQDPNDFTSRTRIGTIGRELGDILRWRNAAEAIDVYDIALVRLGETRQGVPARRDRALVLANSSYALQRAGRAAEGRRRVDEALAILEETKDYPSDRVTLDSVAFAVLNALADQRADEGYVADAIQQYEQLLDMVMAAKPDVDHDLRDAYSLSLLYRGLARLHRAAGRRQEAEQLDAKIRTLWRGWNQSQPNNPFVLRQLAAGDADAQP